MVVSIALLLGYGVWARAEGAASSPATQVATSAKVEQAESDSTASAKQVVRRLFEAIEDQIAATREGPPGSSRLEKVRQAERRIKALAGEDAIRRKVKEALQAGYRPSDEMVAQFVARVLDSWAPTVAYYVGQWQLEQMVPVLHRAADRCTVLVPVLDVDGQGRSTIQVELARSPGDEWKVVRVSFVAVPGGSRPRPTVSVEREPPTDADQP
jgi:hypothetical protein